MDRNPLTTPANDLSITRGAQKLQDTPQCEGEAIISPEVSVQNLNPPALPTINGLEIVPRELLQEIAWLASNPLLYLVSKAVTSRLLPLKDYEHDLALLVWCERHERILFDSLNQTCIVAAWALVPDTLFPWKTPVALRHNWKLSHQHRLELQKDVLNLAWLTEAKFQKVGMMLRTTFFAFRWQEDDFEPDDYKALQMTLQSMNLLDHDYPTWVTPCRAAYNLQDYRRVLRITKGCKIESRLRSMDNGNSQIPGDDADDTDNDDAMTASQISLYHMRDCYSVMDNLYIPSRVFDTERCSGDDLFLLMCRCRWFYFDWHDTIDVAQTCFSRVDAVSALCTAVNRGNKIAFARIFSLLIKQTVIKWDFGHREYRDLMRRLLRGEELLAPVCALFQDIHRCKVSQLGPGGSKRNLLEQELFVTVFNAVATHGERELLGLFDEWWTWWTHQEEEHLFA